MKCEVCGEQWEDYELAECEFCGKNVCAQCTPEDGFCRPCVDRILSNIYSIKWLLKRIAIDLPKRQDGIITSIVKDAQELLDELDDDVSFSLVGRLREELPWKLKKLKAELSRFNAKTQKWKD